MREWQRIGGVILVALACATAPLLGTDGPLTVAPNLRVRTDTGSGYLLVTAGAYSGADGPYTNFGNIKLRTDQNGYLLVSGTGLTGTITGSSAVGDILLGTGGTSFGRLADVAVNQVLVSGGVGVAPLWASNFTAGSILANNYQTVAGGQVYWSGRTTLQSTADLLLQIENNAANTGLELSMGTPALGVCTAGVLVSGSHNFAGQITSNTSSSCALTFGTPQPTQIPFCFAMSTASTTHPRISAAATTGITITGGVSGETVNYFCIGRIGV